VAGLNGPWAIWKWTNSLGHRTAKGAAYNTKYTLPAFKEPDKFAITNISKTAYQEPLSLKKKKTGANLLYLH
jgi:hypothetical protein